MNKYLKIILTCTIALLGQSLSLQAQTNHSLAIFEAKGPVKSITLTSHPSTFVLTPFEGIMYFNGNSTTYNFDNKGNLEFWFTPTTNSAGYIIGLAANGATSDFTYTNGRVSEMKFNLKNCSGEATFKYSSKGNLIETSEMIHGDNIISLIGTYSNYKFDSHGNWIKRSLTIRPRMANPYDEAPSNTVIQTRTITYY